MAHINSIGSAMFSDLSVSMLATPLNAVDIAGLNTADEWMGLFKAEIPTTGTKVGSVTTTGGSATASAGATFVRIRNARTFPAMGTPANIVKVPTYGSKTSSSIQGQADAPQLEIDINYIASEWAKPATGSYTIGDSLLGEAVGNGVQYAFRFTLLNAEPTNAVYTSIADGLGTVPNSQYFWVGKMEALLVTPSLTDATIAKLTLSIQSSFFGAFTS